ncbi:hypothetical protein RCL_jg13858.t1 [Rhizophagus clarus]|uniref:Uncharacterized protein n=1 Tax=Rhizophagus clarus TaxID=94130 RepID=A0A8H3LMW4_9GLOM|nr:hypothetical protein RCL_jg13858.t1 [Rhizophagus clarus]
MMMMMTMMMTLLKIFVCKINKTHVDSLEVEARKLVITMKTMIQIEWHTRKKIGVRDTGQRLTHTEDSNPRNESGLQQIFNKLSFIEKFQIFSNIETEDDNHPDFFFFDNDNNDNDDVNARLPMLRISWKGPMETEAKREA